MFVKAKQIEYIQTNPGQQEHSQLPWVELTIHSAGYHVTWDGQPIREMEDIWTPNTIGTTLAKRREGLVGCEGVRGASD